MTCASGEQEDASGKISVGGLMSDIRSRVDFIIREKWITHV